MKKVSLFVSMLLVFFGIYAQITGHIDCSLALLVASLLALMTTQTKKKHPTQEDSTDESYDSANIAKDRLENVLAPLPQADNLNDDDLFLLFVAHKDKFMQIEKDLYGKALMNDQSELERLYLMAPLMRLGIIKKDERIRSRIKLAF